MKKPNVFVIMPFTNDFFESYEMLKNHFENIFEFSHAGEEDNQQNILADIVPPIYNADIVLADLSGLNPNVMYELGIAHSFNKKTIIITRDDVANLPFDLKQYRTKDYSTHFKNFYELVAYLEKNLNGAIDGSVIYSNPVKDFLDAGKLDPKNLFEKEKIDIDIPDNEKGFVDFIAEIEEDTNNMTEIIQKMTSEMETMSTGINGCTKEITRVNKTGGNGIAAFVRKQAKKASEFISTFSKQLKQNNENITILWMKIEKNILGLFENKYASQSENKESLIEYIRGLYGMQEAIRLSNKSTTMMKESSLKNMGIESSMNQAIRFLDEDLSAYLLMMEQMVASIDRILAKSKFVVGEIDFTN